MKTILLFVVLSFLLVADSVKVDLTVTFHDLTLEQATELEKIIEKEFKDYNHTISIPIEDKTSDPYGVKWGDLIWKFDNNAWVK